MRIITVSGAHSGVGKTKVAEALLKILKGWSALKVTVLHRGLCPVGRDCGACVELSSKFSIVSDENIIGEKGKDTQRIKASGAKRVLWLKAKPEWLKQGLKKAISEFSASAKGRSASGARGGSPPKADQPTAGAYGGKDAKGLIIEGNSVLKYLKPDFAIFVKRENSLCKDSAKLALKKADLIISL